MSIRDEMFGVMGGWRDDVNPARIDEARELVMDCARQLARELSNRASDEKLSDAEVSLINAQSLLESYKKNPWKAVPSTPTTSAAIEAAKEIVDKLLPVASDRDEARVRAVAAIITKHLAARTGEGK